MQKRHIQSHNPAAEPGSIGAMQAHVILVLGLLLGIDRSETKIGAYPE